MILNPDLTDSFIPSFLDMPPVVSALLGEREPSRPTASRASAGRDSHLDPGDRRRAPQRDRRSSARSRSARRHRLGPERGKGGLPSSPLPLSHGGIFGRIRRSDAEHGDPVCAEASTLTSGDGCARRALRLSLENMTFCCGRSWVMMFPAEATDGTTGGAAAVRGWCGALHGVPLSRSIHNVWRRRSRSRVHGLVSLALRMPRPDPPRDPI